MTNPNDRPSNALQRIPTNSPEILEAFRVLADADQTDVPKMGEAMFVQHILPMLSAPAGTRVELTRWLEVAGTPLRALDVVDEATGEVLFRVPPLMRTLPTVFQAELRYYDIVQGAKDRERVHQAMGDHYLANELSKVRTGATLLDVETAKTWNNIRKRYGLPLLTIVDENGKTIEASTTVVANASDGQLSVSDDEVPFI